MLAFTAAKKRENNNTPVVVLTAVVAAAAPVLWPWEINIMITSRDVVVSTNLKKSFCAQNEVQAHMSPEGRGAVLSNT